MLLEMEIEKAEKPAPLASNPILPGDAAEAQDGMMMPDMEALQLRARSLVNSFDSTGTGFRDGELEVRFRAESRCT